MRKGVVVFSGGLDSTTLLHYVIKELKYDEIYALSYNYGQRHSKELEMAKWQCSILNEVKLHKIIDISFMKELTKGASALTDDNIDVPHIKDVLGDPQPITYVPNRNMILLSLAVSFAESNNCDSVFYGAQAHDTYSGYWDASPEFIPAINNVILLNRRNKIEIKAPFVNLKKDELIRIGTKIGVDYSKTWTCYNGQEKACGTCPTCSDRIQAFMQAGLKDPLEYRIDIKWRN